MKKKLNFEPLLKELASRPNGAIVAERLRNFLKATQLSETPATYEDPSAESQKE